MDVRAPPAPTYVFGAYRLDAARMLLERDGALLPLTPRLFSTLLYLVENAGRTVGKDEMMRALWPGRIADEANLSQAISALRKALTAGGAGDSPIVTVPGRGYRFTAPVGVAESASPAIAPATFAPPSPPPRPTAPGFRPGRSRLRLLWAVGAGAAALAAVALLVGTALRRPPALPPGRTAVVIADLQNFTGDPAFNHVVPRILQVDLEQSPFLQVTGDAKVAAMLSLMEQPKGAALTLPLARGVCARADGGAVVAPAIASLGKRFELSLTAEDCVSGRSLYADKASVADKEGVARAIDLLSSRLRRGLGEAQASIVKYDVPLAPERTASFDALRAYSEGLALSRQGKTPEAAPLYEHAVQLDPDFAMAYLRLAECRYGMHQPVQNAAAMTRAYQLRGLVSEPNALLIESLYNIAVTKDLGAARQSAKLMAELYPRDALAWQFLSNIAYRRGEYADAVAAGERAVRLDPRQSSSYTVLARALNYDGQTARADQLDRAALRLGPEAGQLRQQRIAWRFLLGDEAGAERLVAASVGTPLEREALIEAYNFAFGQGRVRHAQDLIERAARLEGPNGFATDWTIQASNYAKVGLDARALAALRQAPAALWTGEDDYWAARLDDPKRAEAGLARDLARWPHDTLLNAKYAPAARAALLLRRGRPLEAARTLDGVGGFMFQELDAGYLRATALLAARDGDGAAAAFRAVLAHPGFGWDPQFALSHLGLARALRLEGDMSGSRREYEAFLTAWKNADPDLPPMRQARAEYARLPPRPAP